MDDHETPRGGRAQARRLPAPADLRQRIAASPRARQGVARARDEIRGLLRGDDPRCLVIVGPCSIHDPLEALEYARRLRKVAHETRHALVLAMRTYFEKPRTALGWKGLLTDPDLDGRGDPERGIARARRLLVEITELGVPCASELLDPLAAGYFGDLLAWAAVGARTSESQTHRELASGLDLPVAFKNGTDGRIETALNAICAAREPHSFLGIDANGAAAAIRTAGNPDAHLVLRGGENGPNYAPAVVARTAASLAGRAPARPILIDCSHDNSGKDPERQPAVLRCALEQLAGGRREIAGVMLESNLRPGRQDVVAGGTLRWGVSITDACLGWEQTESLLFDAAGALGRLGA